MPGLAYFPKPLFPSPYQDTGTSALPVNTPYYSELGIVDVEAHLEDDGLYISWNDDGSNTLGSIYQVYINGLLLYEDISTHFSLAGIGRPGEELTIHIGKVGPENRGRDYSDTLAPPQGSGRRAEITWIGGPWIDDDLVGYNVYSSSVPGGPLDLIRTVGTVPVGPEDASGASGTYGTGLFGRGNFGAGAGITYSWISGDLAPGTWLFAVAPVDATGGMPGAFPSVSVVITGPPPAPAMVNGKRVWISAFDEATGSATITWG